MWPISMSSDMSDLKEALQRLESHERECAVRYEMIQMQLDEQSKRFDRLENLGVRGFTSLFVVVTMAVGILEFLR